MKWKMLFAGFITAGLMGCGVPEDQQQREQQLTPPSAEVTPATEVAETVGEAEQEIIGGAYAGQNQFPYMVRLMLDGRHVCGGTIINPNWVVTAAQCVAWQDFRKIVVVAGDNILNTPEYTEQSKTILGFTTHPDFVYARGLPLNDVAVIRLSSPLLFNFAVQPLALPSNPAPLGYLTVSGWGHTSPNSGPSNRLKYANLPNNPVSACDGYMSRTVYAGSELCVGHANGVASACQNDSGDPLAGNGILRGIASWGYGGTCNTFTVFTDVYSYVSWIRSFTG